MERKELIRKYLDFFKSKGHKVIPSASLVPANDPTVLFTTAGMHPLVPHLLGQKHPLGKRLVNVQKCIRTTDIDEVGDKVHHTFFEMLGNWSLGDYWKKEAINYTFTFQNSILKIPLERYAISCFAGDSDAPQDKESAKIWESLGVKKERIAFLPKKDNWWGPAGNTGPCGPDTEQFYWSDKGQPAPKNFDSKDKRWVEIGNDVLMQYVKDKSGGFKEAKQKNVDFGGGVERTVAVLNGFDDNYLADMWNLIIKKIEKISGKNYKGNERAMRIVADHIKAAVFIISDGVVPENTGRGYVLRRLIRRAIRYGREIGIENFVTEIAKPVFVIYDDYKELERNKYHILETLKQEEEKFGSTLGTGMKQFNKLSYGAKKLSGEDSFLLYQSYGFPIEIINDMAKEKGIKVDIKGFERELEKHQKLSRTASAGTFKSGLADNSEQVQKLHTATHLLNESLRRVLGNDVKQKGSNITSERLRFDFNFPRKLTAEEIKKVEDLVNEKIKEGLNVIRDEMPLKKAIACGAQSEFGTKYPDIVSVYTIKDPSEPKGWFSKEICTGPHVENTREIGKFKITKEESSSAGIRRIKAIVIKN